MINPAFVQQMIAQLHWQAQKMAEMETELRALKERLASLEQQPPVHIDRIEYHFDQLKIETLEGTLNIGISPGGGKAVEELAVADKEVEWGDPDHHRVFQAVRAEVYRYLAGDCLADLGRLEADYQVVLGDEYKAEIIQDLRRQIDKRILYYVSNTAGHREAFEREQEIIGKVKRDIRQAIENHVKLKKQEEDEHETDG